MIEAPEPKLEFLFDIHADLEPPQMLGMTPGGNRQTWVVNGGYVEGPKLKGDLLPGGGDWAVVRADGAMQLDVRATLKLSDGALVHAYYSGLVIAEMAVFGRIMAGEDVPLAEYYFYTNPMFQTAAPQYEWLNRRIAVARGKVVPGGVEYRVWAVG